MGNGNVSSLGNVEECQGRDIPLTAGPEHQSGKGIIRTRGPKHPDHRGDTSSGKFRVFFDDSGEN